MVNEQCKIDPNFTYAPEPNPEYEFNYDLSVCVDINGKELPNVLSYDSLSGEAVLATKKTSFCYLYFDIPKPAYAIYSDTDKSLAFVK